MARLEHFLDQYEDFKAGVRMPPRLATEFAHVRDELCDFPGRTIDAARQTSGAANQPARHAWVGSLMKRCGWAVLTYFIALSGATPKTRIRWTGSAVSCARPVCRPQELGYRL
ncbi:hypothetical protein QFZ22_000814 [Streptomyces canus]|uniref:Uncharacterized protein n=1 Tax=Streptomyces canus TaxID=58343 RepID=A0AAW8F4T8_9ACTN|nr:hypothetical protein [Streptomyces canus]